MKLDPVFTVTENKLYRITDNSEVNPSTLKAVEIKWSEVELQPEAYNEEYLAALREQLKKMDDNYEFVILIPVVDKSLETPEEIDLFINAYNHTARRIKDCVSVAGFLLPEQLTKTGFNADSPARSFMETLAVKHAQYVYFSKGNSIPSDVALY